MQLAATGRGRELMHAEPLAKVGRRLIIVQGRECDAVRSAGAHTQAATAAMHAHEGERARGECLGVHERAPWRVRPLCLDPGARIGQ
jgi:hypothetical protein